jgi:hypothetical protein
MALMMRTALLALTTAACTTMIGSGNGSGTKTLENQVCPGSGSGVFANAVCVCQDLADVGELHVLDGPAGSGSIGVDGKTALVAFAEVAGTWNAWGGFAAVGLSVGDSLVTPGDVSFTGDVTISGSAVIGGNLSSVGTLDVGGALELGGSDESVGPETVASRAPYAAPAGPPCDCNPNDVFDVGAAVAAAKQAANGIAAFSGVGQQTVTLQTGNYYTTDSAVVGMTTIEIAGSVSLYIDGSLASVGADKWKLDSGATLDLFVSGDVASVGELIAGDPSNPGAFELYVGGSSSVGIGAVGETQFYGSIYAPQAPIAYVGDTKVVGALFAKTLAGVGRLEIDYGAPIVPPNSCNPPSGGSGSGSGSGSGGSAPGQFQ